MRDDPQLNAPPLLATIKRLCDGLLSGQMAPTGDKVIIVDDCQVNVTPTIKGPVINGAPDPNVAWSAYASVYDVRVDLYGCGPTPRAAVECLLRDVEMNIARLTSGGEEYDFKSTACKMCNGAGGLCAGMFGVDECTACGGTGITQEV